MLILNPPNTGPNEKQQWPAVAPTPHLRALTFSGVCCCLPGRCGARYTWSCSEQWTLATLRRVRVFQVSKAINKNQSKPFPSFPLGAGIKSIESHHHTQGEGEASVAPGAREEHRKRDFFDELLFAFRSRVKRRTGVSNGKKAEIDISTKPSSTNASV